jgi:hypothetical protein
MVFVEDYQDKETLDRIRKAVKCTASGEDNPCCLMNLPWWVWDDIYQVLRQHNRPLADVLYPENAPLSDVKDYIEA